MGLGHAYEIDPWLEDSFLLELAQAQLVRQIFDRHPIKWMPPTKHKTGDIFHSHVHDAMFNLAGVLTGQSIELLGMFSEAVHTPLLMDRYLSLKSAKYIFGAARHFGDEFEWKADGKVASPRPDDPRRGAHACSRTCSARASGPRSRAASSPT
jgi:beta-lysine 5,6-aminomutase alpha subunit